MNQEALQELARVRAQHDTKTLKQTISRFYRLLQPDVKGEQLQAAHEMFMTSLEQLSQQLSRTTRLQRVTKLEIQGYEHDSAQIESSSVEISDKITALKSRLVDAQQERARRIEYDQLAKSIGKLPDRTKGTESKQKLVDDILTLKQEEETYAETWRQRQEAFDAIVTSLVTMSEAIRDEKAEQDRRRALEEDDGEPEPVSALDPNAKPFEPTRTPQAELADAETAGPTDDATMVNDEAEEGEEREEGEMDITS